MIDVDLLQHLARLARLDLSAAELDATSAELSEILAHFSALRELELTDDPGAELEQPGSGEAAPEPPSEDLPAPWPEPHETLLTLGASTRDGFFVVPATRATHAELAPDTAPDTAPDGPADSDAERD